MQTLYLTPGDDLQRAFDGINGPATVYLAKGVYNQKLEIRAGGVRVIGEEREGTVITYDDCAKKIHADGKEYNTFRTYTLCVSGDGVRLENLTVENRNAAPERVGQCVALSVHGGGFCARSVDLKSTQDTLFLSPFPDDLAVRYMGFIPPRQLYREGGNLHLFYDCKIYGTVDYVFGCAEAYFKNCEFISLRDARNVGFVAAPAHPLAERHGFNFIDCDFSSRGAENGTCFLARPWRDFGKCAYVNCRVGGHIDARLFDKWNDTDRDKTARFLYYGLDCGFAPAPVPWAKRLTEEQAKDIINNCNAKFKANNL